MANFRPKRFILILALIVAVQSAGHAGEKFSLVDDDVVVFVGGTNMVHLQQAGHLEAILTNAFAASRPKFRDIAWEADTVVRQGTVIERWRKDGWRREGFGAFDKQLERLGTTVVIAQFGRLESMAGRDGLAEFTKSYEELVDIFTKQARLVVLVTPTPFEPPPDLLIPELTQHNSALKLYVKATGQIAKARGLTFVDLFSNAEPGLTDNGMHISEEVQSDVAREIAVQLGVATPVAAPGSRYRVLRQAVIEKHRLWYDYWRPANWKLLYGDDAERQFTRSAEDYISFKEEWQKLVPLIAKAEKRVWQIAAGGADPGDNRPEPEKLHGAPEANVDEELAAFRTLDGLQVNLFASEHEGLTSPLHLRWDPAGRMYVTVTTTYPHVFPGDLPNDRIIVLEDTDADGKVDKSTVFAEGLNIPTGIEIGDGGVYVGQNTEVLFLKDNDGDGRADERRVVLGGFGNGDSHQTINSFIWSPDGELYFGHGDGCESRVETPWGASNLFNAGFYRFRPRRLQLLPFLEHQMAAGNPWGLAFDEWGQIFSVDGAGGVNWLTPGLMPTTHRNQLRKIGDPGGYCGIGYVDGRHLPADMHGDFVVGDFKANRVKRFSVKSEGSGYSLDWREPVLQSQHRNFRPVDVKVGPDGAIYVVDWYNPITCHQDDAYRDPTRDKAHGRIWRVSSKAPTVKPPALQNAPLPQVLDALTAPEHWTRYQAKRVLTERNPAEVAEALNTWVRSLDAKQPRYEHHLYEAIGAYATIEVVKPALLNRLLRASNPQLRAFATRMVGRWHDRLDQPLELLSERIADEYPLVRLEAVVACSLIASSQAMEVAARVVDKPMDDWSRYAFTQTVHHLKPKWMPSFQRGELSFADSKHMAAVLNEAGGKDVLESLKNLVVSGDLDKESKSSAIAAILAVGSAEDWNEFGLDTKHFTQAGQYNAALHARALSRLVAAARFRDVEPTGDPGPQFDHLLSQDHPDLKANALRLAGIWNVVQSKDSVLAAAQDDSLSLPTRSAAFEAMVAMQLPETHAVLSTYAIQPNSPAIRSAAIQSFAELDVTVAADGAADLFAECDPETFEAARTLSAFLNRIEGPSALATALATRSLKPAVARSLLRSFFSTGRSDRVVLDVLNRAIGTSFKAPDYNTDFVQNLATQARKQGNSQRGALLFKSMACSSCHKVSGTGGDVGPDLTAIGTTLSTERIVEELLWPSRQVKEGYSVVVVVTDRGRIHTGYERPAKPDQESDVLVIYDLTTRKPITIKRDQIEESRKVGSPMPDGITVLLSKPQLLDLIHYLSGLGTFQ